MFKPKEKKLDEVELLKAQEFQRKLYSLRNKIGELEINKKVIMDEYLVVKNDQQRFGEKIEKKYKLRNNKYSVDIKTGEIKPLDNKK